MWTDGTFGAMERTWKLSGGYATWTVTLTASPPPGSLEPFPDGWVPPELERFEAYFVDMVNLIECRRLLNDQSRRDTICA